MQYRMKTHQLSPSEVNEFLTRSLTGTLSTVHSDGSPYGVPVHFVHWNDAIYFHGLPAGQKLNNLKENPRVCFTVYEMNGFLLDPQGKPCDTNTAYTSVIVQGMAQMISEPVEKQSVLDAIIRKYTSQLSGKEIPDNMLNGTAVVKISITETTGKYYQ